jgi:hypothetical protein
MRRPNARVILFHERIAEVNQLFLLLRQEGFPVIAEHSELPDNLRVQGIHLFREGVARIIVSARTLIEGFDVPAADVGIIVASTIAVRQRIQTLGRLLRKHRGPAGEEKTSLIHVLYAKDTIDELIYEKVDWQEITGADANEFYVWDVEHDPIPQSGPPRHPLPRDYQVDESMLEPGVVYPGRYEGSEYTCDAMGNVYDSNGHPVAAPKGLVERIREVKGRYGRFRITKARRHVLVRVPGTSDDFVTLYVTTLESELQSGLSESMTSKTGLSPEAWARTAKPGDEYPFGDSNWEDAEPLEFGSKRGGVIEKRVHNGKVFAHVGGRAKDPRRGADAIRLLESWRELRKTYPALKRFLINRHGHAIFREGGRWRFLAALEAGLEFPEALGRGS